MLAAGLGARHVVVGYDFTFGAKRSGTCSCSPTLGPKHGFGVTVVPPVSIEGIVCSSTKVREFVLEGRVDGAALVLGRAPEVEGEVVRGDGRGRTIGVPTANLRSETELVPKNGVYAGWGQRLSDGKRWPARDQRRHQPHLRRRTARRASRRTSSTATRTCTAQRLRVGFVARLRDEERFALEGRAGGADSQGHRRTRQLDGATREEPWIR